MWTDFIRKHAQRTPDRPALVLDDTGRVMTYADLDHAASRWAACFHNRGVKKGDRIALLAANRLEHVTMFFACAKVGAVFVPLNFRLAPMEIAEQLIRIEPTLFFGEGLCQLEPRFDYIDLESFHLGGDSEYPCTEIAPDDTLLMLFTSGTTGIAKGVLLHAEMLLWNMINTQTGWELRSDDVSMVHMPFFHTGGYNVTLLPMLRLGAKLVLCGKFEPEHMPALIQEHKISVFFAVPTMFQMIREQPAFESGDFSSVRFCISGGAPCPTSLIEAYRAKGMPMKQGFGLTEVGPNCFYLSDQDALHHPDSVGRPMLHSEMKLVDESGSPVPTGETGELCIKGPHVCNGYWRNREAFEAVCKDGFFHTGDLMKRDEHGLYYVIGRKKEMYISGGENVYPGEVARQLAALPEVSDVLVLAVPDSKWGEVGFAFLKTEHQYTLNEVREFLNPRLSRYKHPHHLRCLTGFPLLPNNKVDRKALQTQAQEEMNHG